jgi:hypothetical protein
MKRFLNYLKGNPTEVYYVLSFILVLFVSYGVYTCAKIYGCRVLENFSES